MTVIGEARTWAVAALVAFSVGSAQADDSQVQRGAYLVNTIGACGNCHTPKGADGHALPGQELSGGLVFDFPVFHAVVPNITPDNDTGIGTWTDEQIANSIRNGKRPDGTTIGPPMPIGFYRNMSDSDVLAVVAYLRSVTPIPHKLEKSTFRIPLPESYGPAVVHVTDVPSDDKVAYGKYLADIGHCMECHTPMTGDHLDMARVGAGGRELPVFPAGVVTSANLTPADENGIANWTDAQIEDAIVKGIRPDGRHLVLLWHSIGTRTSLVLIWTL